MKTKLFNQLKQAYASKYGVADEILQGQAEALAATGLVTDENIATVIQGQENVFRAIQTKFDKTVTGYKKELDELKTKKVEVEEKKTTEEIPAYIQKILDGQQALSDKVNSLESEKTQTSLSSKLISTLKEKKIPESYYSLAVKGRSFKDEAEVTAFASELDTAYVDYKQELKNLGFDATLSPENGSNPVAESLELAEMIGKETKQIEQSKK